MAEEPELSVKLPFLAKNILSHSTDARQKRIKVSMNTFPTGMGKTARRKCIKMIT